MSQQDIVSWDFEREIQRLPENKVKSTLRELLLSLVRKGIFTQEEIEELIR